MSMHGNYAAYSSFRKDPSVVGQRLAPGTVRRIAAFARPYRAWIALFLVTVVIDAVLVVATPLLFKRIIDDGVTAGDSAVVVRLSLIVAVIAVADALLTLVGRWWSSRIGEGLIYDLRTQVFDHVQRMPVAFFTRTQTGALISRLNSDVIGAQQAFTSTLSGVVSNLITLVLVVIAMLALSWPITVAALVLLPVFLVPGQVGRPAAAGAHPRVDAAQRVDEHRDDRALQRLRRAAGEALRPARGGGRRLRGQGRPGARHRRPDRHEQPGLLHRA